ncbi:MAG: serine hydrolase [Candidatus Microthrix subdominans]
MTSTLVGIAQDQGYLSIDEPASTYLDEWVGTDSEDVTIGNLLSNDSGRYHDMATDYIELNGVEDRTAFAIDLGQQDEPGTEWIYNNAAIQTLEAVLERATGQPVQEFAQENLFGPIGMTSEFVVDAAGNPPTFMGVQAGCLDLARFGLMALAEGNWDGTQVVSRDWLTEATSPIEINAGYGHLWWLNADGGWQHPRSDGIQDDVFWPELPLDAFAARGLGGQTVLIIPSEKLVITRIGKSGVGGGDQVMETLGSKVIDARTS